MTFLGAFDSLGARTKILKAKNAGKIAGRIEAAEKGQLIPKTKTNIKNSEEK